MFKANASLLISSPGYLFDQMPPADPLPSLSSAEWQSEAEVTDGENAAQAVVSEIGNTTPPEPEVGCESQRKSKKLLVCNI